MSSKSAVRGPNRHELASQRTHDAAKAVVDAETKARLEKTERLRAARLSHEASQASEPEPAAAPATKRRKG